jgi:hypothetical protein
MSNCIGQTFDIEALRQLGLVDENDELIKDEIHAKQTIRDDGTVEIQLPTD